jgi:AraC-like DNA-binding protein
LKKQEITSVLKELHKITGFRMSLHDSNFVEITAYPKEKSQFCAEIHKHEGEYQKCHEGDKLAFRDVLATDETVIYKCRYGLTEAICPLYNFGILTGYLMAGQICDDNTNLKDVEEALRKLPVKESRVKRLIEELPIVKDDLILSYVKVMQICAQYLTLSNAMPGLKPTIAKSAHTYIYENLDKKITIKDICEVVGCSKTTLISSFKKEFGTTVNVAITKARLEKAKKLLSETDMSISEVAGATGFYDQAYFSKVFSSEYGKSPSEYKNEVRR